MPATRLNPNMSADPAGYRTKAEWAYLQLRQWIQSGALEPEERLDQEDLAARLGVSRVPLRQALIKLQADGLVVSRPHAGATVAPLSLADAEDIYAARAVLEPMLTEIAAARIADEAVSELEHLTAEQQKALEAGDRAHFLSLDREFHERLYTEAGYRTSLDLVKRLRDLSERYVAAYQGEAERSNATLVEHREIVQLCAERDGVGAARAILDHVRHGIEYLRQRSAAEGNAISANPPWLDVTVENDIGVASSERPIEELSVPHREGKLGQPHRAAGRGPRALHDSRRLGPTHADRPRLPPPWTLATFRWAAGEERMTCTRCAGPAGGRDAVAANTGEADEPA